jgi:hypothetical protein
MRIQGSNLYLHALREESSSVRYLAFRILKTKNWRTKTAKIVLYLFFDPKLQLTYPYASIKTSKLQEKPSALRREHPANQKKKFIIFFFCGGLFLPSWMKIRNPGLEVIWSKHPSPWIRIRRPHWIRLQYGSGSTTLLAFVAYPIF